MVDFNFSTHNFLTVPLRHNCPCHRHCNQCLCGLNFSDQRCPIQPASFPINLLCKKDIDKMFTFINPIFKTADNRIPCDQLWESGSMDTSFNGLPKTDSWKPGDFATLLAGVTNTIPGACGVRSCPVWFLICRDWETVISSLLSHWIDKPCSKTNKQIDRDLTSRSCALGSLGQRKLVVWNWNPEARNQGSRRPDPLVLKPALGVGICCSGELDILVLEPDLKPGVRYLDTWEIMVLELAPETGNRSLGARAILVTGAWSLTGTHATQFRNCSIQARIWLKNSPSTRTTCPTFVIQIRQKQSLTK